LTADGARGGDDAPRPGGGLGRLARLLARLIALWAILGGIATAALALMTAGSAVSNLLFDRPFAAEHELTKHVVAVVIFTFLPYCQLVGANVTVDIFTERIGETPKIALSLLASVLAAGFAILLLRQMSKGLESYMRFVEVTPVLGLPLWTAFPPILFSLALLLLAALITFAEGVRRLAGQAPLLDVAALRMERAD
jgi:TRAP-type C4-dicarboxylate transport system permease small subunit